MTDEALKLLAEQELYSSYPLWTLPSHLPFFGGIIGSIGLLMKKMGKTCIYYFLLAIIIQMIHTLFFYKAKSMVLAQKSCLH
jgi:hypothetical protein